MADKNFIVKNGLEVGGQEVVSSSGVVTSAALGGQTLASTDSPTFNNLTLTNDIAVGGDINLTGDLNITGDVNSVSVTDLDVTDQTITLGKGQAESASGGSGIVIDGSGASILWDETNDTFDINKGINVLGQAEFSNKLKVYSENNAVVAIDSLSNAYMVIDRSANNRRGALVFSTAAADVFNSPPATATINWALGVSDSDELSGNKFAIKAGDTNFANAQFVIDTSGNVGIGTTGPSSKLHVHHGDLALGFDSGIFSSANTSNYTVGRGAGITMQNADVYTGGIYGIRQAGGWDGALVFYTHTNSSGNTFGTTFTEKMRIGQDGKIGIGTDNPNANLHIGSASATGDATNPALQIGGASTYRLGMYTSAEGAVIANANGDDGLQFVVKTAGEAMRIDGGTGYVGIGTNNPSKLLHVNGQAQFENNIVLNENTPALVVPNGDFRIFTGGSETLRITSARNLKFIAQTTNFETPGFTYHTNNYLYLRGGSSGLILSDDSGINTIQIIDGASGYINFETSNGSSKMRINSSGQVLIGDTASHTDDLLQIETPASGGGHGIQIRRNDSNSDQGIGHIQFGNNTDTDLARISAKTDGSSDNAALLFSTQPNGGALTERLRITDGGDVSIGSDHSGFSGWRVLNLRGEAGSGALINWEANNSTRKAAIAQSGSDLRLQVFDTGSITFEPGTGTERMRINASGNFEFNTTANAANKYFIINQVNDGALIFKYNNTNKWQQSLDGSTYDKGFYSYTAGRHVMKMHADGRDFDFTSDTANDYTPRLNLYSKSTGAYSGEINFYSKHNSNEWVAASIFTTGGSGYGTGNPPSGGMRLYVRGEFGSTHGINAVDIAANGVVSGDFNDTSDVALKKDIVSLNASDSLTAIKALNPVSFKWKLDDEKRSGFIAQEVEEHLPDDVIGEDWKAEVKGEEGDPTRRDEGSKGKAVNTTGILAHAVKVIQEQQTIIDDLKSRIEALEG